MLSIDNQLSADALIVPGVFIDQYLPAARGDYVKIYLYFLRFFSKSASGASLAGFSDLLDLSEKEILKGLAYWESQGLMALRFNSAHELSSVTFTDPPSPDLKKENAVSSKASAVLSKDSSGPPSAASHIQAEKADAEPVSAPSAALQTQAAPSDSDRSAAASSASSEPLALTSTELAELSEDQAFSELLFIAQSYFARTFKPSEIDILGYWYLSFQHSFDVMEYLLEYCAEQKHTNIKYLNAVARNWHEAGFRTLREIKEYSTIHNKTVFSVMKAFGLGGRNPGTKEYEYIHRWSSSYGFSDELILLACSRTLDAISKPSFPYADSILASWYAEKAKTLEDVARLDASHKKHAAKKASVPHTTAAKTSSKFHNFEERPTDYDHLVPDDF